MSAGESSPERVFGAEVMVNALDTLGIRPAAGRFFTSSDVVAGQNPTAVLSYGYWRQNFAGNPQAIGQTLRIDGVWRAIIGSCRRGRGFPIRRPAINSAQAQDELRRYKK